MPTIWIDWEGLHDGWLNLWDIFRIMIGGEDNDKCMP
jgi:hypothetical protein